MYRMQWEKPDQFFRAIDKLRKCQIIGRASKTKIFNSTMKAVLLYASESWIITHRTINKLQVFINRCLRKTINVHWRRIKLTTSQ